MENEETDFVFTFTIHSDTFHHFSCFRDDILKQKVIEKKSPNKKDWGSWLVHRPGSEFNRTFYGFFNFWHGTVKEKSVDTTEKNASKLVKLPSLKVVRLKREKI